MKKYYYLVISLFCITGTGYAQETKSEIRKKVVTINKNIATKVGYNYFLLDMVNDADAVFTEYEDIVQRVWDGKLQKNLTNSSREPLNKLDQMRWYVSEIKVYEGGNDYRDATHNYIDALEEKVKYLEKLGILGADPESDVTAYYDASRAYTEVVNRSIEKRNILRNKKSVFEKTTYMKMKNKKKNKDEFKHW